MSIQSLNYDESRINHSHSMDVDKTFESAFISIIFIIAGYLYKVYLIFFLLKNNVSQVYIIRFFRQFF